MPNRVARVNVLLVIGARIVEEPARGLWMPSPSSYDRFLNAPHVRPQP